jgi:hypothetical protein
VRAAPLALLASISIVPLVASPSGRQARYVVVPDSDGDPVLVDGLFTEGEWDDAAKIDAGGGVTLLFKQEAGHVFIGVMCPRLQTPVVDLFIQTPGEHPHQLHASAQIGERLVGGGEDVPFVWGRSPDWQANEVRWDQARREQLVAEGMDQDEAQRKTIFPYQGFEFQIRHRKLGGTEWRLRVEVPSFPDYDTPLVFPAETEVGNTDGWLRLKLRSSN